MTDKHRSRAQWNMWTKEQDDFLTFFVDAGEKPDLIAKAIKAEFNITRTITAINCRISILRAAEKVN